MIFGSMTRALRAALNPSASPVRPAGETYADIVSNHKFFLPPPAGSRDLTALYNTNQRVRSIVSKVSRAVAKQDWYLEDRAGKRIDDHDALAFLRRGCDKLRGRKAMQATAAYMDINGESFWVVGRDARGRPVQYAPIPPYWVMDVPDDLDNGVYRVSPINQAPIEIPARDVLAFRDPDLITPYGRGSSFLKAANFEVDTDAAASSFLRHFFKNNARPDLVVSGTKDNPLGRDGKSRLETYWDERHRGSTKAGRPFFSNAPLDIKELGKGLRDNEVTKLKDQLGALILEHWGVPPEIMGRLESSNRATIDSADYLFSKFTLVPRLDDLEDGLAPFLDAEFNLSARGLTLKYADPVSEDNAHLLAVISAFPDEFTRNEKRAMAKLAPVDDGDDLPAPVNEAPEPTSDGDEPPPAGGGKKSKAGESVGATEKNSKECVDTLPAHVVCDAAMRTHQMSAMPSGRHTPAPEMWKAIDPAGIIQVSQAHQDPQVTAEATGILEAVVAELVKRYGDELLAELEVNAVFQVNSQVAEYALSRGSFVLGNVDATTRDALRSSLIEGVAANEDVQALADRIDEVFRLAADTRAALIGQTEATAITGFGSLEVGKQAGFTEKEWLTSEDQAVRATHQTLDGQRVGTNDVFRSESGATAQHPGAFGTAAEDVNCRCAIRPVIPGEKALKTPAAFRKFQAKQAAGASAYVEKKMRVIFAAQAEVAKAVLKRVAA